MTDIALQSFDQIAPGRNWNWERVSDIRRWRDLYDGNLQSLFAGRRNLMNGLNIVDPNRNGKMLNACKATSRFYQSSLTSELPIFRNVSPDLEEQLIETLGMLALFWSYSSEGVVLIDNGELSAVSPEYYHPIKSPYNIQRTVGHALAYDYFEGVPETNNVVLNPNALRVVKYQESTGLNQVENYAYAPFAIQHAQGEAEVSNVGGVWHVDTKDPYYNDLETIAREIIVRENALSAAINMTIVPFLEMDWGTLVEINKARYGERPGSNAIQGWDNLTDEEKLDWLKANSSPAHFAQYFMGGIRQTMTADTEEISLPVLPKSSDTGGDLSDPGRSHYVERSGTGLAESFDYLKHCFAEVYLVTGVPPIVGGVDLSGVSTAGYERLMFSAQARVSRFRRQLERIFVKAAAKLGFPQASVTYHSEPFATLASRTNAIIFGWTSGLIQRNEARQALGHGPLEGQDIFIEATKMDNTPGDTTRQVQSQQVDVDDRAPGLNNNPNGNQGQTGLADSLEAQLLNR